MRETNDPTMPPPALLEAVRQPRRTQLHDPCVKALLAEWEERGYYSRIEYHDLCQIAEMLGVKNPKAPTRRWIVAAVEAAGIEIHNLDAWRRSMAERGMMPSLSGWGVYRLIEEMRWRWPEKWDRQQARQRRTCLIVRRGRMEYILKRREVKPSDEVLPWPDDEEVWLQAKAC
jgi:hypothetical protein